MNYYIDLMRSFLRPIFNLPYLILVSVPLLMKGIFNGNFFELRLRWYLSFNRDLCIQRTYFHPNVLKFIQSYRNYYGDNGELAWVFKDLLKTLHSDKWLYEHYSELFNDGEAISYIIELFREHKYIKTELELLDPCSRFYREMYRECGEMSIDYRHLRTIQ